MIGYIVYKKISENKYKFSHYEVNNKKVHFKTFKSLNLDEINKFDTTNFDFKEDIKLFKTEISSLGPLSDAISKFRK